MSRFVVSIAIVAGAAIMLALNGASLEMSILASFTVGCFYVLCDISNALHKSK